MLSRTTSQPMNSSADFEVEAARLALAREETALQMQHAKVEEARLALEQSDSLVMTPTSVPLLPQGHLSTDGVSPRLSEGFYLQMAERARSERAAERSEERERAERAERAAERAAERQEKAAERFSLALLAAAAAVACAAVVAKGHQ